MRPKNSSLPLLFLSIPVIILASGFVFFASHHYHKEVPLGDERELKVTLSAGFGNVAIAKGATSAILDAGIETNRETDLGQLIDYSVRDRVGYLSINANNDAKTKSHKHSVNFEGFGSESWNLNLTDAVPISFDISLGLGRGDFDFSGMRVKDLRISAGASSVWMTFERPNKSVIEDLTIESGLSKFSAEGLCNANFNHMKFEGGVGSYVLDFGGKLTKEVDVDIDVGLGSLTVKIPEEIGARIIYEKSWIAHIDLTRDFTEQQENNYYSSNYRTAAGKMNIKIDAGLGSVNIVRE
jgi:uncharacterized protein DUF2154